MIKINSDNFQETVTYFHKNRKNFFKIFSIFFAFIIIFFVIISLFLIFKLNNNNNIFNEKKYYIVYAKKSKSKDDLSTLDSKIKSIGGSGEVINFDGVYYLTVCVYNQMSDSVEIESKIKKIYPSSGVLVIETKIITNNFRKIINSNSIFLSYFSKNEQILNDFIEKQLLFLSGQISNHDYLKFLISSKLFFDDFFKNLSSLKSEILDSYCKSDSGNNAEFYHFKNQNKKYDLVEKLFNYISLYLEMEICCLSSNISEFYSSSIKESISCAISCQIIINFCDFCNNLSNQ